MASLYLPAPTRRQGKLDTSSSSALTTSISPSSSQPAKKTQPPPQKRVPSYASRCDAALSFSKLPPEQRRNPSSKSKLFVPRSTADFDDGGAFPEIHVGQYPRHMGNPHLTSASSSSGSRAIVSRDVLSATVDADGKVSYDAIVTGGTNADKKVYAKHSDLRGCNPTPDELSLPTEQDALSTAERTQRALNSLLSTKVSADKPTGDAITAAQNTASAHSRTQFIKYTPHESAPGYNPNASQRIIRMVPLQTDPMMPPKHMARKAPRGPAEDPVPILHAPPEKLSKEERESWNIPACISNWKNTRGYTIPLDKRLAADGRGLRDEATVNSNFAVLSESLYVAERQAREEVRTRAAVQKRLIMKEREEREEELRELANKARMERGGAVAVAPSESVAYSGGDGAAAAAQSSNTIRPEDDESVESTTNDRERMQRDRLRAERRREREKEYRLERAGKKNEVDATEEELAKKKRRLENDRDVSEKIALGTHVGTSGGDGVDSRLYSQNAGLDSGFGAEDEYNTYSRPMFDREGVTSSSIYRPTRGEEAMDAEEQYSRLKSGVTGKFVPDKGFGGAEGGAVQGGASRNAPVQFEKAK